MVSELEIFNNKYTQLHNFLKRKIDSNIFEKYIVSYKKALIDLFERKINEYKSNNNFDKEDVLWILIDEYNFYNGFIDYTNRYIEIIDIKIKRLLSQENEEKNNLKNVLNTEKNNLLIEEKWWEDELEKGTRHDNEVRDDLSDTRKRLVKYDDIDRLVKINFQDKSLEYKNKYIILDYKLKEINYIHKVLLNQNNIDLYENYIDDNREKI